MQKKVISPYCLSRPRSMAIYLYCPQLHQLAVSTRLQVDQTCTVGYTLAHILSRRRFKELNQSENSVMGAIGDRIKGVVPSHGGTQRWAIIFSYLILLLFLVSRATFNGDIQSWDKWGVFNHPIPYWILDSIYPFPIQFLGRCVTCPLHYHGSSSMVSCII